MRCPQNACKTVKNTDHGTVAEKTRSSFMKGKAKELHALLISGATLKKKC